MSFDLFVSSFRNGEPADIRREQLAEAFKGALRFPEAKRWEVEYDSVNACELYVTLSTSDPEAVTGFMVSRPCADLRFWDSLLAVMRLGNLVLYYPGGTAGLAASEEAIRHLPEGMAEALGGTACVRSGKEIRERIESGR